MEQLLVERVESLWLKLNIEQLSVRERVESLWLKLNIKQLSVRERVESVWLKPYNCVDKSGSK